MAAALVSSTLPLALGRQRAHSTAQLNSTHATHFPPVARPISAPAGTLAITLDNHLMTPDLQLPSVVIDKLTELHALVETAVDNAAELAGARKEEVLLRRKWQLFVASHRQQLEQCRDDLQDIAKSRKLLKTRTAADARVAMNSKSSKAPKLTARLDAMSIELEKSAQHFESAGTSLDLRVYQVQELENGMQNVLRLLGPLLVQVLTHTEVFVGDKHRGTPEGRDFSAVDPLHPLLYNYLDKLGEVNIMHERITELLSDHDEQRRSREFLLDQDQALEMNDERFEGTLQASLEFAKANLDTALLDARQARDVCISNDVPVPDHDLDHILSGRIGTNATVSLSASSNGSQDIAREGQSRFEPYMQKEADSTLPQDAGRGDVQERVSRWIARTEMAEISSLDHAPMQSIPPQERSPSVGPMFFPLQSPSSGLRSVKTDRSTRDLDNLDALDSKHTSLRINPLISSHTNSQVDALSGRPSGPPSIPARTLMKRRFVEPTQSVYLHGRSVSEHAPGLQHLIDPEQAQNPSKLSRGVVTESMDWEVVSSPSSKRTTPPWCSTCGISGRQCSPTVFGHIACVSVNVCRNTSFLADHRLRGGRHQETRRQPTVMERSYAGTEAVCTPEELPTCRDVIVEIELSKSSYLIVGTVFRVVNPEPYDASRPCRTTSQVLPKSHENDSLTLMKGRFYIVIEQQRDYVAVLGLHTYGRQGVATSRCRKSEHCIVYTGHQAPEPLPEEVPKEANEKPMKQLPIRINKLTDGEPLFPETRLNLAKIFSPIDYKQISASGVYGFVDGSQSMNWLLAQWRAVKFETTV